MNRSNHEKNGEHLPFSSPSHEFGTDGEGEVSSSAELEDEGKLTERERSLKVINQAPIPLNISWFGRKQSKGFSELKERNDVLLFFLKEYFFKKNILGENAELIDPRLIINSIMISELKENIKTIRLSFSLNEKIKERKLWPISFKMKVLRKYKNESNYEEFITQWVNFKEDFLREIKPPFFFKDTNFTISLDKELKKDKNIQYVIFLDSVIFTKDEELYTWNIENILSSLKTCFLNVGEKKIIFKYEEKNSCKESINTEFKKVVWDENGKTVLSVENVNNGFINDPVSQKLKDNKFDSRGFYLDLSQNKSFNFLISFSYKDLFEFLDYKKGRSLVLDNLNESKVNFEKLSKVQFSLKKFKRTPHITTSYPKFRVFEHRCISCRDEPYFFYKSGQRWEFEGYEDLFLKELVFSKWFRISNKRVMSGVKIFENNSTLYGLKKNLKTESYKIGDFVDYPKHLIYDRGYKPYKEESFVKDDFTRLYLEEFVVNW